MNKKNEITKKINYIINFVNSHSINSKFIKKNRKKLRSGGTKKNKRGLKKTRKSCKNKKKYKLKGNGLCGSKEKTTTEIQRNLLGESINDSQELTERPVEDSYELPASPEPDIWKVNDFDTRGVLFFIIVNDKPYFIKCSLIDKDEVSEIKEINKICNLPYNDRKKAINELDFDHKKMGRYLYESRIYFLVNQAVENTQYENNVVKIIDYGIYCPQNDSNDFNINIEGYDINIAQNQPTSCQGITNCIPTNTKSKIRGIADILYGEYGEGIFSYMITECTQNYFTLNNCISELSEKDIKKIFSKTLEILDFLRGANGFAHCDLHWDNLLVNKETADIKLFDFDLSVISGVENPPLQDYSFYNEVRDMVKTFKIFPLDDYDKNIFFYYDKYRLLIENLEKYRKLNVKFTLTDINGDQEDLYEKLSRLLKTIVFEKNFKIYLVYACFLFSGVESIEIK